LRVHQLVELLPEELLGAGEVVPDGELEREGVVVELLADVGHDVRLVHRHAEHLRVAMAGPLA